MKKKCKKYGLALSNYVLFEDEVMDVSREELISHLKACQRCRQELFDWQTDLTVLLAEEYDNRPDIKARTAELIRRLLGKTAHPIGLVP